MSKADIIYQEIYANFPVQPVPENPLRRSQNFPQDLDRWPSLQQWIAGRTWTSLKLHNWAMIGTTPGLFRYYFDPNAFHYYLPSIMAEVCETCTYPEFAIESLAPPDCSDERVGRELGLWWTVFTGVFTSAEKSCVSRFVSYLRSSRDDLLADEIIALDSAWWLC
jgi:hypothetical protein